MRRDRASSPGSSSGFAFLPIGKIAGPFGVRGMARVAPLTEFGERFVQGTRIRIAELQTEIEEVQLHGGRLLVKFSGIETPEQVRQLGGETIYGLVPERPQLEEGEFLASDLIGLAAVTEDGRSLGPVEEILPYPAHDVLRIGSLLVPLVRQFVVSVDLHQRRIVLRLIEGMGEDGA
ncbi:MAG: ribosome maturation factor RimM [Fimbriimonadales bacterium]|nr:ribosome maturation factor RimM [Fimbriimonadales bacterium]